MIFIFIMTIMIYFILIAWTWQSLAFFEKPKRIAYIVIGFIVMYVITFIVFQTTKSGLQYQNEQMQLDVQNIIVLIFTGINGIIAMPQLGRILDKIDGGEKEKGKKRLIILLVIFIICLIIESGYMKNIQQGILSVYRSNING